MRISNIQLRSLEVLKLGVLEWGETILNFKAKTLYIFLEIVKQYYCNVTSATEFIYECGENIHKNGMTKMVWNYK